jgi:hypothetical protein
MRRLIVAPAEPAAADKTCIALSFNGRTSDSDSLDRGSNPWGATKAPNPELPRTSPTSSHTRMFCFTGAYVEFGVRGRAPTRAVELLRTGAPNIPALQEPVRRYIATLKPYQRKPAHGDQVEKRRQTLLGLPFSVTSHSFQRCSMSDCPPATRRIFENWSGRIGLGVFRFPDVRSAP